MSKRKPHAHSDEPAARTKRPIVRFVAVFALLMAGFYGLTATPWFRNQAFPAYLEANAKVGAAALGVLGEDARANGVSIISPRFALTILRGCDGIEPAFLFIAAVLAFPAPIRSRFIAALAGAVILLSINVLRIVSLYFVGVHWPKMFDLFHVEVWQAAFIFLVMAMWMIWAWRMMARMKASNTDARP